MVSLFAPICKKTKQIVHGNNIPASVREAFRLAEEERPGPVLLELPEDIAREECDARVMEPHVRHYGVACDEAITEAANLIQQSKRILLLVGAGANRKDARTAISEFVESTGIPFFNTTNG